MASVMATRRLRKELLQLQQDPPSADMVAAPLDADILTWHYAFRGPPQTPYEGGVYVGKLKFPPAYPMAPPAVYMLTPTGRFQCNTRLCLSMSDFHPESWNPAWNVGTLLQGIVSFLTSEEVTTGALSGVTTAQRQALAQQSHAYNIRQGYYQQFFGSDDGLATAFGQTAAAWQAAATKRQAVAAKSDTQTKDMARATTGDESTSTIISAEDTIKELTEAQKEKRRIKNAKKKAKQKAKKQQQQAEQGDVATAAADE